MNLSPLIIDILKFASAGALLGVTAFVIFMLLLRSEIDKRAGLKNKIGFLRDCLIRTRDTMKGNQYFKETFDDIENTLKETK